MGLFVFHFFFQLQFQFHTFISLSIQNTYQSNKQNKSEAKNAKKCTVLKVKDGENTKITNNIEIKKNI